MPDPRSLAGLGKADLANGLSPFGRKHTYRRADGTLVEGPERHTIAYRVLNERELPPLDAPRPGSTITGIGRTPAAPSPRQASRRSCSIRSMGLKTLSATILACPIRSTGPRHPISTSFRPRSMSYGNGLRTNARGTATRGPLSASPDSTWCCGLRECLPRSIHQTGPAVKTRRFGCRLSPAVSLHERADRDPVDFYHSVCSGWQQHQH